MGAQREQLLLWRRHLVLRADHARDASGQVPVPPPGELLPSPLAHYGRGGAERALSNELAEFVSLCLNKNEIKRPSANDLLKHHWLRKHPTDDMLLSASLEKMML